MASSRVRFWLKSALCLVIGYASFASCASRVFDSQRSASPPHQAQPPTWVYDSCSEKNGRFYFVGYGSGDSLTASSQQAAIDAKRSALLCLFSGEISLESSLKESNTNMDFRQQTRLSIAAESIDWTGFHKVPGMTFVPSAGGNPIYVQYSWTRTDASASLETYSEMKESRVQAGEPPSSKSQSFRPSPVGQIVWWNGQPQGGAQVQEASTGKQWSREQVEQQMKEIAQLGCGFTFDEILQILGPPVESSVAMACDDTLSNCARSKAAAYFTPHIVLIYPSYRISGRVQSLRARGDTLSDSERRRALAAAPLTGVEMVAYLDSDEGFWICQGE